jgi:hypothetical protein
LITSDGDVYHYRIHILLGKYNNNSLDEILNILNNHDFDKDIYAENPYIDPQCNDLEDFVLSGFFYFRGQTYRLDNGQKVNSSDTI